MKLCYSSFVGFLKLRDQKELHGMTKSHKTCDDETLSKPTGLTQKLTTVELKTSLQVLSS